MSLPELTALVPPTPWLEAAAPLREPWTFEVLTEASELEALEPEWNELLQSSDANCFFLTWEWLSTWWRHLRGERRLSVVTVRHGARLMGLAPLTVADSPPWRRRSLQLLGTGAVGSDYLDLVLRREHEAEAISRLADAIARAGRVVELAQLPAGRSAGELLRDRLAARGWQSLERVTHLCPVIDLSGCTWESYVDGLGRSHRQNLRRRIRKLEEHFRVDFRQVTSEDELPGAFDVLLTLHRRRWLERGGSDALADPAVVAFHRELTALALRRGWLRLFVLRLDGKPAAALYGFRYQDRFLYYQSGFDPAFEGWSVGLVIMALAIRSAIEEGAREYDLLHGAEPYKFHWANGRRDLVGLELYPPSPGPLLRKRIRRTVRRAKDRLRGWLDPESPPRPGDSCSARTR